MDVLNLKKKSAYKFIQNQLKKAEKSKKVVPDKLNTIGIIADLSLWKAFDFVKDLETRLKLSGNKFRVVLVSSGYEDQGDFNYPVFSEKDLGMFGKIKTADIKDFTEINFDLLINYSGVGNYLAEVLLLKSQAKLKAGFFNEKADLYDISIKTGDNKIVVFNEELGKYLKIMGFL